MGLKCAVMDWNDLVRCLTETYIENSICSVIRRLGLAASVYLIWQERNWRLFKGQKTSLEELYDQFYEIGDSLISNAIAKK